MSASATSPKKWCCRFAASSPAYELYAPKGLRWRALLRVTVGAVLTVISFGRIHAQTIVYPDFAHAQGLTLNGDAAFVSSGDGHVVQLAPKLSQRAGAVFTSTALNATQFSTMFEFRMTHRGGANDDSGRNGADGLAFVVQTIGPNALGNDGAGLGFEGMGVRSIAIEFDTFRNVQGEYADPDSNHIGFNVGGSVVSQVTSEVTPNFDDGQKWTAWIDYDGSRLEVRISGTGLRPEVAALVVSNLNLASAGLLASSTAFVGFTASTGAAVNDHDLVSWTYSEVFLAGGIQAVPEPATYALLAAGLGFISVAQRRFRASRL